MRLLPPDRDAGWTPYAWLVYLGFFIVVPFLRTPGSPIEITVVIVTSALFLALYFRAHWLNGPAVLWPIAAMTVMGIAFIRWNPGACAFFIYAASFASHVGETKFAARVVVLIELIVIATMVAFHLPLSLMIWPAIFVALVGGINIHYAQVHRANARLRMAQDEIEHLAKVAERERIARDLHDLLGHTLSLITIKSELASKLADRDIARAAEEIRDVERISREALAQVRDAVRGYRSEGLAQEIAAVRRMLDAAGVQATIDVPRVSMSAQQEAILALIIREGVTNLVRHAHATKASIALAETPQAITLVIADDGIGKQQPDGSGVSGMRERVESLGGTVTIDTANGTTITVTVPVTHHAQERSA